MRSIVLLKSESRSSDFEKNHQLFLDNGIDATILPALSFKFVNLNDLVANLKTPDYFAGMIFTSPRTVQAVSSALILEDIRLPEAWLHLHNYCVGPTTRKVIEKDLSAKMQVKGEETGNAAVLAALIAAELKDGQVTKPFLYPCSKIRLETLEKNLNDDGFALGPVECYETIKHELLDEAVAGMDFDVIDFIVFFSPSTVVYFLDALETSKRLEDVTKSKLIAIGPSTREEMEKCNLSVYGTCSKPTVEALMNIVK